MPIFISEKPGSNFSDPIGLLTDCHRRIEKFLQVLRTISVDGGGKELTNEQRVALDTSLRYFREAAPLHTRDEEESLFPRMLTRGDSQRLAELLVPLNADHRSLED